jgi:hypothetical protein
MDKICPFSLSREHVRICHNGKVVDCRYSECMAWETPDVANTRPGYCKLIGV